MIDRRGVLLAGSAVAAVWALPLPLHASTIFPLRLTRGDRLMLAVEVNGRPLEALLDSAAEASFLDRQIGESLGLIKSESVTARGSGAQNVDVPIVKGVTLAAAGLTLRNQTIAIADLSDVGRRLLGHKLDMILGRELFDAARLRIDIGRRELEVLDLSVQPLGEKLPLKTVNGIELLPVQVEGAQALAAFDLGNGSNLLIGAGYAKSRGLLFDGRAVTSEKGGGLGGETVRRVIALKSLELAGVRLTDVPASIDAGKSATDINIGTSVLKNFVITTDFRAHTIWLAPVR